MTEPDVTGDVISWVIVIILLFAFPPIGILLLYLKLRNSAKPAQNSARWADARAAGEARVETARQTAQQPGAAGQQAAQANAASRQSGNDFESSARKAAQDASAAARQAAQGAGAAVRLSAQEAGTAARQIAQELEAAAKQFAAEFSGSIKQAFNENQSTGGKQAYTENQAQSNNQAHSANQSFNKNQAYTGNQAYTAQQAYTGNQAYTAQQAYTGQTYGGQQAYTGRQSSNENPVVVARGYSEPLNQNKNKKKKRSKLDKKSGKFLSVVLLLVSIAMFFWSISWLSVSAQEIFGAGQLGWFNLFMGISTFAGAIATFFSRNVGVRRISRYKNYYAFTSGRDIVPMSDIARASGLSVKAATRDIQSMINAGYFDFGAYIDSEFDCLVLRAGAAEELRKAMRAEAEASPSEETLENQYMTILAELREINHSIADVTISGKVDRIEELTAKIFRIVEENPEKKPQIRRFMSYYLPTTFKLLRSYSTLEKQGVKGENIMSAKENIGRILDTLATGFEQQLDQLFQADAIDIAADINVIENLMQQDGLTNDKPVFKTMTSGG